MSLLEHHGAEIERIRARYADRRSALLPVLYIAQDTYGTLTGDAIREVAEVLDLPPTDVFEVVGFYTLFYEMPLGKWVVQVCDDVPCCYLGAEDLIERLQATLNAQLERPTADGMFLLQRVKCLAACDRAPVVQANLSFFYDVTADRADALINFLREHADTAQANSVSGHYAEDYEPGDDGTFRQIVRDMGDMPARVTVAPPHGADGAHGANGAHGAEDGTHGADGAHGGNRADETATS